MLQHRLDDDEASQKLFERSLAMTESSLDPSHPFVAQILEDYAVLLREMGEMNRAEKLEARARAIETKMSKSVQ